MNHLRQLNLARHAQENLVLRYISEMRLSLELGNRIMSHLRREDKIQGLHLRRGQVPALQCLPVSLQRQLEE
eukprot:CAMPEP_0170638890 /NCGR_PEP_ID=MMETSP0224-20130122/39323_1 /TAXON_ID=285029 /ORGANISM="Togula jolla, Strain CCCM 725" /LENGTH=71 /DNA_ID=CAMNT_0010969141 /DNA_START=245 /DNA_END=457 /DNA_ORIENTATION=+